MDFTTPAIFFTTVRQEIYQATPTRLPMDKKTLQINIYCWKLSTSFYETYNRQSYAWSRGPFGCD